MVDAAYNFSLKYTVLIYMGSNLHFLLQKAVFLRASEARSSHGVKPTLFAAKSSISPRERSEVLTWGQTNTFCCINNISPRERREVLTWGQTYTFCCKKQYFSTRAKQGLHMGPNIHFWLQKAVFLHMSESRSSHGVKPTLFAAKSSISLCKQS